jgi:hypothetical protein
MQYCSAVFPWLCSLCTCSMRCVCGHYSEIHFSLLGTDYLLVHWCLCSVTWSVNRDLLNASGPWYRFLYLNKQGELSPREYQHFTVFSPIQDNSNLRLPPRKTCLPRWYVFTQI